jgi:hypothetical protein
MKVVALVRSVAIFLRPAVKDSLCQDVLVLNVILLDECAVAARTPATVCTYVLHMAMRWV